jgi:hypothetical protein
MSPTGTPGNLDIEKRLPVIELVYNRRADRPQPSCQIAYNGNNRNIYKNWNKQNNLTNKCYNRNNAHNVNDENNYRFRDRHRFETSAKSNDFNPVPVFAEADKKSKTRA